MSRINTLESLYPPFREIIEKHLIKIQQENLNAYLFETYRSFDRQLELYSQGRKQNSNGQWNIVDKNKIITKALPGKSWHTYGLAVDYAFDGNTQKAGMQWTWDDADVTKPGNQPLPWNRLGKLGIDCGLEWAGNWVNFKEFPHFQYLFGFSLNDLYPILVSNGIEAVWKKIDSKIKPVKNIVVVPNVIVPIENKIIVEEKETITKEEIFKNSVSCIPDKTYVKNNKTNIESILDIVLKIFKFFK
jgi:peptidoglycan L-alanyl-D-glutamate endopeptidase CwlK